MQSVSHCLWALVAALLSLVPESLALRTKRTVAPYSPTICQHIDALRRVLCYAEVRSFGPLRSACAGANSALCSFAAHLRRELPALAVSPLRVDWSFTGESKSVKQPHVHCRVIANGEPCNCIAEVLRFELNGVECARLPVDKFPQYLCTRHATLLPVLCPHLASQVSEASPDRFGTNSPWGGRPRQFFSDC